MQIVETDLTTIIENLNLLNFKIVFVNIHPMLSDYIQKNIAKVRYKLLENKTYFGEIPGLKGVWASAKNLEVCRTELAEVLEDWLFLKLRSKEKIAGFSVHTDQRKLVKNAK